MSKQTKKKVLKINNTEFLFKIYSDRMETCGHIKGALDMNELDWETIVNIMHNLHKQGYKAQVVEVG